MPEVACNRKLFYPTKFQWIRFPIQHVAVHCLHFHQQLHHLLLDQSLISVLVVRSSDLSQLKIRQQKRLPEAGDPQ